MNAAIAHAQLLRSAGIHKAPRESRGNVVRREGQLVQLVVAPLIDTEIFNQCNPPPTVQQLVDVRDALDELL